MGSKVEAVAEALARKPGGIEWLFDQIAAFREIGDIAKELGCTPRALYRFRDEDEDRKAEWSAALRVSGDVSAAEGKEILDKLAGKSKYGSARLESAEVALATARARDRMKIAAARNPEAWGERQPAPVVTLNIGSLHLDALKAHGSVSGTIPVKQPLLRLEASRTTDPSQDTDPIVHEAQGSTETVLEPIPLAIGQDLGPIWDLPPEEKAQASETEDEDED